MSVEPFLISSSMLGILAKRLVRVLWEECKCEDEIAEECAEDYTLPRDAKIYKADGCKACNYSGYAGRRSIGELLVMNNKVRDLLKTTTEEHTIKTALEADGLKPISVQLNTLLLNGETSLDEAIRIGLGNA
jgi:general secretion pathway protein E